MFDLGWSKLLIIAILAIVVVGPKELPGLMRTIGKFLGHIKRQADEFRGQLRDAMKDTEFEQIGKDVADIRRTAEESVRDIGKTLEETTRPLEETAAEIDRLGNAPEIVGPEGQTNAEQTASALPEPHTIVAPELATAMSVEPGLAKSAAEIASEAAAKSAEKSMPAKAEA
jgi:sec-independent protein translocase protein TatB